jgi:hypothetical protein
MSNNRLILILFFLYFNNSGFSQKYEFGIGAGISTYKGDISPHFNPLQLGIGGNALFRYKISRSVTLRANLVFSNYNAKDENTNDPFYFSRNLGNPNSFSRNLGVSGNFLEGSILAEYNFFNSDNTVKNKDWTPYLFGGIGFVKFKYADNYNIPFSAKTPIIPFGVGLKHRFKGPFSIGAEFGTVSDKLDLSFGQYLGNTNTSGANATNDKIHFGDTSRKDQYFFTSITLTYTIFNIRCIN